MSGSQKSKRILVVDDEAMIRRSFQLVLRHLGHEVAAAESGTEALGKVRDESFDLVFLDFEMTGMRGDQLAREIKLIKPNLPIVLTTGSAPATVGPEFSGVLRKPFAVHELKEVIETWS
ncbi:MAG: response regulator [Verrucomicrobiota bacterium]